MTQGNLRNSSSRCGRSKSYTEFKHVVYVCAIPATGEAGPPKGGLPVEPLRPGERVVTESVVELTKALRDLLAKDKMASHRKELDKK